MSAQKRMYSVQVVSFKFIHVVVLYSSYFMPRKDVYNIAKEEELMNTEAWGSFCMVHNGWVMGDDPLRNFAEPGKINLSSWKIIN